jgi:hypothetical protein
MTLKAMMLPLAVMAGATMSCAPAGSGDDPAVRRVIERSKTTTMTYALYQWTRLTPLDAPASEKWAAEFNSGTLHRVETPNARLIADCREKTGAYLFLTTGEIIRGEKVAEAACGINTAKPFLGMQALGRVTTPYGKADRVRVIDADDIRTYDVTDDGVLVQAAYQNNSGKRPIVLVSEAAGLEHTLPSGDMFSEASLRSSFVPARYRTAPRPPN